MNIIDAIEDPNLFRPYLQDKDGSIESWRYWTTALKAMYGLPVPESDMPLVTEITGRTELREGGHQTGLFLTGRRSGKSRIAGVVGAFEAVLAGHEAKLAKGEKGVVLICSPTRSQSRIVKDYVRACFDVPLLQREVVAETKDGFELANGNRIEILAGSWQTVRGYTVIGAVIDEIAFFGYDDESKVKSDTELVRAIRPSLATVNGRLIAISSPYAPKGWCHKTYTRNFGNNSGDTLVLNAPSRTMNALLPQSIVDQAMAEDPAAARAEYLGQFRDDVASFLPREVIEACVFKDRHVLPPVTGISYVSFVDISGGRSDDAALAIGHKDFDSGKVVLDLLQRWRPPFSPDLVIGEMCAVLLRYGIDEVVGDNYSAEFVRNSFRSRGVDYQRATPSDWNNNAAALVAKPKSQLYAELMPRLCSGEIELLDNEVMVNQFANLERRTRSGGRDIIDHPQGGGHHDDLANVVAGVCDVATRTQMILRDLTGDNGPRDPHDFWTAFAKRQQEHAEEERRMRSMPNSMTFGDAMRSGLIDFGDGRYGF